MFRTPFFSIYSRIKRGRYKPQRFCPCTSLSNMKCPHFMSNIRIILIISQLLISSYFISDRVWLSFIVTFKSLIVALAIVLTFAYWSDRAHERRSIFILKNIFDCFQHLDILTFFHHLELHRHTLTTAVRWRHPNCNDIRRCRSVFWLIRGQRPEAIASDRLPTNSIRISTCWTWKIPLLT